MITRGCYSFVQVYFSQGIISAELGMLAPSRHYRERNALRHN